MVAARERVTEQPPRRGRDGGASDNGRRRQASSSRPSDAAVRLDQPRPDTERLRNEYSDVKAAAQTTEYRPVSSRTSVYSNSTSSSSNSASSTTKILDKSSAAERRSTPRLPADISGVSSKKLDLDRVVGKEKRSRRVHRRASNPEVDFVDLDSEKTKSLVDTNKHKERRAHSVPVSPRVEIVCGTCGRCRCSECARPRYLPSTWVCNDSCLLSTSSIVDVISCMCCVRAVRYHCFSIVDETESVSAEPLRAASCSGSATTSVSQWICLGLASLCLPCLCCYFPLRMCEHAAQLAYRQAHDRACHCRESHHETQPSPITTQPTLGGGDKFNACKPPGPITHTRKAQMVVTTTKR